MSLRILLIVLLVVACQTQEKGQPQASASAVAAPQSSAPATAKSGTTALAAARRPFSGEPVVIGDARDIAARDALRRPDRIMAGLGLSKGERVADIGAGFGYLTFRLSKAVGSTGRVVATDIDSTALDKLRSHRPMPENIVVRKVAPDDPGLEPGSYDLVLLSEVDHYLPDRVVYLKKLRAALAPKGEIAVTNRLDLKPPLIAAARDAGYAIVREVTDLPHHYLVFLRPSEP